MRSAVVLFAGLCTSFACFAQTITFDSATPGAVPPGWTVGMTHKGGAPKWEILKEDSAPSKPNVLAQVSRDATGGRFPLAVYDRASVKDGTLSVMFKAISGNTDQAAGLVWRYKDPENYYIVRANALEDNIVLYKVEKGERIALAPKGTPSKTYGVKHRVPKQTWSTLSVSFQGNVFAVSFDGQKLFDLEDSTFPAAGKVGLWTKADSVTYFDNFQIDGK
jgi:hypothetical protein